MGASGEAIIFLMPVEKPYVDLLRSKGIQLAEDNPAKVLRGLALLVRPEAGQGSRKGKPMVFDAQHVAMSLTRSMVNAVGADDHAKQLASDAFRSYVRAYATHSGDLKQVFHVRNLHLGHIAFSFCLREPPRMVGSSGSSAVRKRKKHEEALSKAAAGKKKVFRAAQILQDSDRVAGRQFKANKPPSLLAKQQS